MQPDNLISLKDDMVAFIAGHGMRRLNGFVSEDIPTVVFEDDSVDAWKDFVEHAKAAGAPFVVMSEAVLEKPDIAILLEQIRSESFPSESFPGDVAEDLDEAEHLVRHVGKVGYLQLGFAHQGIMFVFEIATDWYESYQSLLETVSELGGIVTDYYDRDE